MSDVKVSRNYRLSPDGLALIDRLAERWGLSQAGAIEAAVRLFGRWTDTVPADLGELLAQAVDEAKAVETPPSAIGRPRKAAPVKVKQVKAGK